MRIEVILLAAGASSRMGGVDKLLREVDGEALLRRSANVAIRSKAGAVHVVLPPGHALRQQSLDGLAVRVIEAADWREGMAESIRAGLGAVASDCKAVIIALADMPEVTAGDIDELIGAFDPAAGREICRAVTADGVPGHPVLFGRGFFGALMKLDGDRGARDVLDGAADLVVDVVTHGASAVIDLDTPEDWEIWRSGR